MAAATRNRNTKHYGPHVAGMIHGAKVKANAVIYAGTMFGRDATGYVVPVTAATGLIAVSVAKQSADATGKASGALEIEGYTGVFGMDIGTAGDALTELDVGKTVYGIDNQTVGKTDGGATRSAVGKLVRVEGGQAFVQFGIGDI